MHQCFVSSCLHHHVIICRRDRSFIYRKLFPIHSRSDTEGGDFNGSANQERKEEFGKSSSENREKSGKKKSVGSDWASQRRRRETNYASEISPGKREQPVRTWQQFCLSLFSPVLFLPSAKLQSSRNHVKDTGCFANQFPKKKKHIS